MPRRGPPGIRSPLPSRLGRGGLPGKLGKSAERLGVAHRDVGEHRAVHVDARAIEAVDELRVAEPLATRRGVDADDPQAAKVSLAVATVAVGVLARTHQLLLGKPVAGVLAPPVAARLAQRLAPPAARCDGALDAAHRRPLPASSARTRGRSCAEIGTGRAKRRLRFGGFFSSMWLEKARRPRSLPLAVLRKRFFEPEWVFVFGIAPIEAGSRARVTRRAPTPPCLQPWSVPAAWSCFAPPARARGT